YWRGVDGANDPVGARVRIWGKERTIVGVVGDIKDTPSDHESKPALYFPYAQQPQREMIFAIRADVAPLSLAESARQAVSGIDEGLPVANLRPFEEVAGAAVKIPRFVLILVSVFAGAALFLAAIGIYGVMLYSVTQRMREIGIRLALGAQSRDVIRLIAAQGMKMASVGVGAGLIGAYAMTRFVETLVHTENSIRGMKSLCRLIDRQAMRPRSHQTPSRRRIVPARLVNVSLRRPSGIMAPIAALPFARDFCASRNNRKNHSGAFAIGAVFFQRYRSPPV